MTFRKRLKPATLSFLSSLGKGVTLAARPGQRTLIRGSNRRMPFLGRSRLYANRTHGGYRKGFDIDQLLAAHDRHMAAVRGHTQMLQRFKDQGNYNNPRFLTPIKNSRDEISHRMQQASTYQRLIQAARKRAGDQVKKDMEAGDAHISAALGGDTPRRSRKKYPPLSLARLPNGEVK